MVRSMSLPAFKLSLWNDGINGEFEYNNATPWMEGRMNIHERKGRIGKPFLDKIGAAKLMNWRQASAGGPKKDLLSTPIARLY